MAHDGYKAGVDNSISACYPGSTKIGAFEHEDLECKVCRLSHSSRSLLISVSGEDA